MESEEWRVVQNCHYEISNRGRLKNSNNQHILTPGIDRYGYAKVSYCEYSGIKVYRTIHRLVAQAWLANENNLPQVNHLDGVKLNNYVNNLEWCSAKTNIIHSYENLLNGNTNPVVLIDLQTSEEKYFRSIKSLAKDLGIYGSILVPLIKNSENNPIYGKFVIRVAEEALMQETANSVNFGRPIYVYDAINEILTKYSSILIASYHTGIRGFSNIDKNLFRIGYYATFDETEIPKRFDIDKEKELLKRIGYLNVPYRKQNATYYVYDYYTRIEKSFNTTDLFYDYLINAEPSWRSVSKTMIASAVNKAINGGRNGLVKGFGVKSSFHPTEWYPYPEEVILSSRHGYPAPIRIYEVTINGNTETIFGFKNLSVYLNFDPDRSLANITHKEIVKASNIPNLSVRRLDLPITEIR